MSGLATSRSQVPLAVRDGDADAFQSFVGEMIEPMMRQAMAIVKDAAAAHDIVQTTCVGLWKARERLPDTIGALRAYCFGTLIHQALSHRRSGQRRQMREREAACIRPLITGTQALTDPADIAAAREAWELAMALPPPLREVIFLRFGLGMTIRETAEALGVPQGTVSTRQRIALDVLRDRLIAHEPATVVAAVTPTASLIASLTAGLTLEPDLSHSLRNSLEISIMASTTGSKSTGILALVIVLLLAMLGIVGWAVFGGDASGTRTPNPTASSSGNGHSPLDGQPTPSPFTPDPTTIAENRAGDDSTAAHGSESPATTGTEHGPDPATANANPPSEMRTDVDGIDGPQPPIEEPPAEDENSATGIAGRVVDSSGQPVVGATVTPSERVPDGIFMAPELEFENGDGPDPFGGMRARGAAAGTKSATTDENGKFVVRGLKSGTGYRLRITAGDEFLARSTPAPALRENEIVDAGTIRLDRPGQITGIVRDQHGHPVATAIVRIGEPMPEGMQVFRSASEDGGRMGMAIFAGAEGVDDDGKPRPLPLGPGATRTAEDGSFTLDKIAPGRHMVSARKSGHLDAILDSVEVRENSVTGPIELRVGAPLTLAVIVRNADGYPIEGATVRAGSGPMADVEFEFNGGPSSRSPAANQGKTDATGRAVIENLSSRNVTLRVSAEGYTDVRENIVLAEVGETEREVTLHVGGTITGRVIGPDGAPMRAARIHMQRMGENNHEGPTFGGNSQTARSGDDGAFSIGNLEPGPYRVKVTHFAAADATFGPFAVAAGETTATGDLKLQPAGTIEVTVTDAQGNPVKDAVIESGSPAAMRTVEVEMGDDGGPGMMLVNGARPIKTNAEGRATLTGVNPGKLTVRARKRGFANGYADAVVAGGQTVAVTITLTDGGKVSGVARRRDGSPWAGISVSLRRKNGDPFPTNSTRTDADGRFFFDRVAAGEYRAVRDGSGFFLMGDEGGDWFRVVDGETTTVEFTEPPSATLAITVRAFDGTPAANRPVVLGWMQHGANGAWAVEWPIREGYTDANGQFTFANISLEGAHLGVQITAEDGTHHVFPVAVESAGEHAREFKLPPPVEVAAGGRMAGLVRHAETGLPAGGVTIIATRTTKDNAAAFRREITTGSDGRFSIDDVPAGDYRLEITAPSRALEVRDFTLAPGGNAEFEIELHPVGHVLLMVQSTAGTPTGTVKIEATLPGEPHATRTRSGQFGETITFENLRLGATYEVTIFADGHAPTTTTFTVTPGATATQTIELAPK